MIFKISFSLFHQRRVEFGKSVLVSMKIESVIHITVRFLTAENLPHAAIVDSDTHCFLV